MAPLLEELGYSFERAKTNLGLGRMTNIQKKEVVGGPTPCTGTVRRKVSTTTTSSLPFRVGGKNDQGAVEKQRTFLRICVKHGPANMGNSDFGSYRPSSNLGPTVHWNRETQPDYEAVIAAVHKVGDRGRCFRLERKGRSLLKGCCRG